jgi:hypothetical protein
MKPSWPSGFVPADLDPSYFMCLLPLLTIMSEKNVSD